MLWRRVGVPDHNPNFYRKGVRIAAEKHLGVLGCQRPNATQNQPYTRREVITHTANHILS
jgi:hypothetical protein